MKTFLSDDEIDNMCITWMGFITKLDLWDDWTSNSWYDVLSILSMHSHIQQGDKKYGSEDICIKKLFG